MSDEEVQRTPYAQLWLDELGGTVPEALHGWPVRRRRPAHELAGERPGRVTAEPTRPDRRA